MKKFVFLSVFIFMIFGFVFHVQAASLVALTKNVGLGAKGESVLALQNFLVAKGHLSGVVDGKFGPKTKAAVIAYQKANKISPTGFVGPLTIASINKSITSGEGGAGTTNTNGGTTVQPLSIKNISKLPSGQVSVDYSIDIEGVGGSEGYSWNMLAGSLPLGLDLVKTEIRCIMAPCYNWSPVKISGTPYVPGVYSFTLEVVSGIEKAQKDFTIEISK